MPTLEPFEIRDVGARSWGREVLIAHTSQYLGKVLYMNAGHAGGLQFHREKVETFFLFHGRARVTTDKGDGILTSWEIGPCDSIHVPAGAVHKVEAIEDCIFFEVSTPHFDDRVRCEAFYGLPDTGGLPTTEG
jgi:mannose-6-phosphate isomerase-like protein (cupin superfamily)